MPDKEAVNTEPLSVMDAIREITDTGKRQALAKFIQIMSKYNTRGWNEQQYFDAWQAFQVAERLDRIEKKQETRQGVIKSLAVKSLSYILGIIKSDL